MSDCHFLRTISSEAVVTTTETAALATLVAKGGGTRVRIVASGEINFAIGLEPVADASGTYLPPYVEFLTILAEGEKISVIATAGTFTAGIAYISVVSVD